MCSRKCDKPASSTSSPRDPAPMKKPRAADRTELMCSVTTRSPESSVVSRCSGRSVVPVAAAHDRNHSAPLGIAVAARASLAVTAATAAVAARAPAVAARPAVAAVAAAGADGRELLLGLAGDLRVLGEAQADAATLLVDLDDADGDL